jgi:hypothetical protein
MESYKRKLFLGANWKSNGTTAFVKDIISHLINTLQYDPSKIGKYNISVFPNQLITI